MYGYGYAFCGSAVAMSRDGRLAVVSDQVFRLLWGQREVALSEGENILGRGTDSLVWIDAQSVSRRLARVMVASGLATRDGDELRIGNVPMTLKVYSKPSSTETATGY